MITLLSKLNKEAFLSLLLNFSSENVSFAYAPNLLPFFVFKTKTKFGLFKSAFFNLFISLPSLYLKKILNLFFLYIYIVEVDLILNHPHYHLILY